MPLFKTYAEKLKEHNLEVFRHDDYHQPGELAPGYYWWSCSPGCLPEGDPNGPSTSFNIAAHEALEGVEVDLT